MPYYTLHASQFFYLSDQLKEQVQAYLARYKINPNTTEQFTIDGDLRGIAVIRYVTDPLGNAQLDAQMQPITENDWIPLNEGEGPPAFLHAMVSSLGSNSNQFVGDGRILDPKGKEIPR
jgi:hypothetical protein